MLCLENVRFEILRDPIVHDFSLNLQHGEVKALFGPSGCGKTTVLRLIAGLETPKSGTIRNTFRKTGFLFQENRLPENLTAMQNIAIFMDKPDEGEIIALAAKVGLTAGDLNKYPTELSGGMAKRVAFLRLLLCGCDLALLDEPFVGLDRDLRDILVAMLVEKIERQGMACMLVTHDRFEAARLSHEIMLLSTKGMNVKNVITLPTPLSERDSAFEEAVVPRGQGIHYEVLYVFDCVNQGPTSEAYAAVNQVVRRGYGKPVNTPDVSVDWSGMDYTEFREEIQRERARELAYESLRKGDLIRWGIFLTQMKDCLADANKAPSFGDLKHAKATFGNVTARDVLWPIPSYEMALNTNLKQNPGW